MVSWLLPLYRFIIFSPSLIVYRADNCGKKCGNLYGQRIFIITIQGLLLSKDPVNSSHLNSQIHWTVPIEENGFLPFFFNI